MVLLEGSSILCHRPCDDALMKKSESKLTRLFIASLSQTFLWSFCGLRCAESAELMAFGDVIGGKIRDQQDSRVERKYLQCGNMLPL